MCHYNYMSSTVVVSLCKCVHYDYLHTQYLGGEEEGREGGARGQVDEHATHVQPPGRVVVEEVIEALNDSGEVAVAVGGDGQVGQALQGRHGQ